MEGVGPGGALPTSEAGDYELDSGTSSPGQNRSMHYDMRRECRSVDEFEKVDRISEGTYGVVYRAREKATGRIVALKRVKMEKERDGFPVTSVREIGILLNFHHANIVNVEEVVISPKNPDHIFMVMEYMDHDLKSLMDDKNQFSRPFSVAESKCLMLQLLSGVSFLHQHWVLHRDIKTSNILYNSKGDLKLCDFGMARQYGDPLQPYTHLVVTLWYRAPELLLGQQLYSTAVDVWSCGCIMAEILTGKPLLMGHGELDQLDKMVQVLGTPTEAEWPGIKNLPNYNKIVLKQMPSQLRQRFTSGASFGGGTATLTEAGFDLLSRLLAWDPEQRITTEEALQHRWFSEPPLPQKKELMPMFAPRKAG